VTIAFITDGGLEMGMGHVQQSITLAKELRDRAEICFLTKSDEIVVNQIEKAGFNTVRLRNDNAILNHLREIKPDMVIIDKLDVDEDFARKLKNDLRTKLAIFTNLTSANRYADIAVTADIGSNFRNVRFLDTGTGTLHFHGVKYWILKEDFYVIKRTSQPSKTGEVLLIFGGSDPSNLTSLVLNELLGLSQEFKIDVILGAYFKYHAELNQVLAEHETRKQNISLYQNVNNVAESMSRADLVITSPGLSAFEALRVGTPVIIIPQNSLQRDTYQGFIKVLNKEDITRLDYMIKTEDFVSPDDKFIKGLEIGEGKKEIVSELIKLLNGESK
jgi:UDP-2,4-diacetamido-2,4,6-trideoxy-beta-L-altropyranose hydrolase